MRLFWSLEALEDLAALREFIERDDPAAARRTALRIVEAVETLIPANPKVGRPGRLQEHGSSSSPARPLSSPIGFMRERSRYCGFSTARAAGPIGYEGKRAA